MLLYTDYVCKPDAYKIEIDDVTDNTVTMKLAYKEETVFEKRYWFTELDSKVASSIVHVFCDHIVNKEDTSDFAIKSAQSSLEKVWSKFGSLVWQRPSYK